MAAPLAVPPLTRRDRSWFVVTAGGLMLVLSLGLVLHLFPPAEHGFYPQCTLFRWTGLHCPGCGSLRALHALSRGDVGAALGSNLVVTLALPVYAVLLLVRRARHGDWSALAGLPAWGWWLALLGVLAFGLARNLPIAPFSWLAP